MSIYTSIAIAAFGITIVFYSYGIRRGGAIVAFIFLLAGAGYGLDWLWPEVGQVVFLSLLVPLAGILYLTRARPDRR